MSIIRGTTPTITFNIISEIDLNEIAELWITFRTKPGVNQKEKTFTLEDVAVDAVEKTVTLSMSQEDTLDLGESAINVQMRVRMNDDMAYASSIIETSIGKILKDGVI